jgi:hypothetical protein
VGCFIEQLSWKQRSIGPTIIISKWCVDISANLLGRVTSYKGLCNVGADVASRMVVPWTEVALPSHEIDQFLRTRN